MTIPAGEIPADEILDDLDLSRANKEGLFNFALNRVPEAYKLITERRGAIPPA